MKRTLKAILAFAAVIAASAAVAFPKYIDVAPKAVASMSVSDSEQETFLNALQVFAKSEGLTLNATIYPKSPADTIGAILVTPKENEIQIVKGIDPHVFDVNMSVRYEGENWEPYWDHLRKSVGVHFGWKDEVVKQQSGH